jgi:uroporphyrinogen decarboxylase
LGSEQGGRGSTGQGAFLQSRDIDQEPIASMTSRERTLLALDHRAPDRIPIDFWASAGLKRKIGERLGLSSQAFLDRYDVDLRYIGGPRYIGPALAEQVNARDGRALSTDVWGVARVAVELDLGDAVEYYSELAASPLQSASTVDDVTTYDHWPSPDWFDYSVIEGQCDAVRAQGRAVAFMGDRMNRIAQLKPAMYLCGIDTILMNMALVPDIAHAVFAKIREFYNAYLERILAAANGKIDIVVSGDDFGTQRGLFMAPEMWDAFLREGFRDYNALVHTAGARVMHHTCGAVQPLIPRLIACGLDVLQSIQPEADGMSARDLKAAFGAELCFQGGVSIQKTMPYGTPDDVREEVKALVQSMGREGGYIFGTAHNIQADTPIGNVVALLEAYHEFG